MNDPKYKSLKPAVNEAVSELRNASSEFAQTAGAQVSKFKEIAQERADQLKATATDKLSHSCEVTQQQWNEARVKAREIHVTAEDYIRQNPTKAVLGALGIGFLIGLIARN